jgi:transposase-like protein
VWAADLRAHLAPLRYVPFLDYDGEIRRVICSTNAIESLNARYRRAVRARGHFPTEQAALKCLYLGPGRRQVERVQCWLTTLP